VAAFNFDNQNTSMSALELVRDATAARHQLAGVPDPTGEPLAVAALRYVKRAN
jgi:hypothetical protein